MCIHWLEKIFRAIRRKVKIEQGETMEALFRLKCHQLKALEATLGNDARKQIDQAFKKHLSSCLLEVLDFDELKPSATTIERQVMRSSMKLYSDQLNSDRIATLPSLVKMFQAVFNSELASDSIEVAGVTYVNFGLDVTLDFEVCLHHDNKFRIKLKRNNGHVCGEGKGQYSLEVDAIINHTTRGQEQMKLVIATGTSSQTSCIEQLVGYLDQVTATGITFDKAINNWSVTHFGMSESNEVARSVLKSLDGEYLSEDTALEMKRTFHSGYMEELSFAKDIDIDTAKAYLRSLSHFIFGDKLTSKQGFEFGARLAEHLMFHALLAASTEERVKALATDFLLEQMVYTIKDPLDVEAALKTLFARLEDYRMNSPQDCQHSNELLSLHTDWFLEASAAVFTSKHLDDDDLMDNCFH